VWILGIAMTKFGKRPDKDRVELAAEAALAALKDGDVTMADMGVLAAGNLMGGGDLGQLLQKQIGQTGIPVFNVANACATGATAIRTVMMSIKAGETDMGLAVGVEKLAGAGLLGVKPHALKVPSGSPRARPGPSSIWTAASARPACQGPSRRSAWSTHTSTAERRSSCSPASARRTTVTAR
jgi:acetyl-CoA acetyltransferase